MPVESDPRPGNEIAGFRLEELLGRGGMGAVYRALDLRLGRKVAIKLLPPQLAENERVRERFLRESQVAASLDHPNVVPIYAAGDAEGQLYLAMRFVDGEDLRTLLAREAPLAPERALQLVGQVAAALDAAHARGLVHRDVKPGNVLVADEHCYLGDFGLTKQASSISGLTGTGELVGTVAYTAPEQIRGEEVDPRADVYSLACVLYECLTGAQPFARDSEVATLWAHVNEPPPKASAARPELGRAIDAVLARGLAKKPEQRHASCGELVAAATEALRTPERATARLPPRRALLVAGLAAVLAAALAAALAILWTGSSGGTRVAAGSVGVIDPARGKVAASIPIGFASPLIAAGAGAVWLVDPEKNTLTRIDPKTNRVLATRGIPTDGVPMGFAAGFGSLWIAVNEGRALAVLEVGPELGNLRRRIVLRTASIGTFSVERDTVVLAVGQGAVWALERGSGEVVRIDPASGAKTSIADGLAASSSLAVGRGALWLGGIPGVTKLDAETGVQLGSTPVQQVLESRSTALAVGPGSVWFVGSSDPRLRRISPAGNEVIDSFAVGAVPTGVAVADGDVWVSSAGNASVSRLDPAGEEVETIELGSPPSGIVDAFDRLWTSPASPPR